MPTPNRPRPLLSPSIVALLALTSALAAAGLTGCDSDGRPAGACPETCPCAPEGCAPGWCGALLTLDPGCATEAPAVEVSAAGCLEPEDLVVTADGPPAVLVPCGAIPAGATGALVVRGEGVQWGPFDLDCPEGGGLLYPVGLKCPAP